ncbi:MAG: hypothetical protein D6785_09255, partial [Planctomycetota bacterium]
INPNISPQLEFILSKCLSKKPSERYQDWRELERDLEATKDGKKISVRIEKKKVAQKYLQEEKNFKKIMGIALGAALLLLLFVGFYFFQSSEKKEKDKTHPKQSNSITFSHVQKWILQEKFQKAQKGLLVLEGKYINPTQSMEKGRVYFYYGLIPFWQRWGKTLKKKGLSLEVLINAPFDLKRFPLFFARWNSRHPLFWESIFDYALNVEVKKVCQKIVLDWEKSFQMLKGIERATCAYYLSLLYRKTGELKKSLTFLMFTENYLFQDPEIDFLLGKEEVRLLALLGKTEEAERRFKELSSLTGKKMHNRPLYQAIKEIRCLKNLIPQFQKLANVHGWRSYIWRQRRLKLLKDLLDSMKSLETIPLEERILAIPLVLEILQNPEVNQSLPFWKILLNIFEGKGEDLNKSLLWNYLLRIKGKKQLLLWLQQKPEDIEKILKNQKKAFYDLLKVFNGCSWKEAQQLLESLYQIKLPEKQAEKELEKFFLVFWKEKKNHKNRDFWNFINKWIGKRRELVEPVFQLFLQNPDFQINDITFASLLEKAGENALPYLEKGLEASNKRVRYFCGKILFNLLKGEKVIVHLYGLYLKEKEAPFLIYSLKEQDPVVLQRFFLPYLEAKEKKKFLFVLEMALKVGKEKFKFLMPYLKIWSKKKDPEIQKKLSQLMSQ